MEDRDGDDNTLSSNLSGVSSVLDNATETDEFGNRLREFARTRKQDHDEQRMHDATTTTVQAFKRARPRPRVASILNRDPPPAAQDGLDSSNDVAPAFQFAEPHNIPAAWGKRGRQRNDYLRRLSEHQSQHTDSGDSTQELSTEISPRVSLQDSASPDAAARQGPTRATDRTAAPPTYGQTTPSKLPRLFGNNQPRAITKPQDIDDSDIVVVESPAASASSRRQANSTRQHETGAAAAHQTGTLKSDEPSKRSPLPRRSVPPAGHADLNIDHALDTRAHVISHTKTNTKYESPSPIKLAKSAETVAINNRDVRAGGETLSSRPDLPRQDSRDILRQLARSGVTPPPSSEDKRPSSTRSRFGFMKKKSKDTVLHMARSTDLEKDVEPVAADSLPGPKPDTPGGNVVEDLSLLPDVSDESILPPVDGLHKRLALERHVDALPSAEEFASDIPMTKSVQTGSDRVGAALSLLAAKVLHDDEHKAVSRESQKARGTSSVEARHTGALHITSTEAETFGPNEQSSTMIEESEEVDIDTEMLQPEQEFQLSAELDEDTMQLISNVTRPLSDAEQERRQEQAALNRMKARLKEARSGLRDVNRGMKRVEMQVELADEGQHERQAICQHCGSASQLTASSIVKILWRGFRSLFYTWPAGGRLRLTWLGITLLTIITWCITEETLW